MSTLTPLMRQYRDIKRNQPDAILFFRLGDFYEMFGQDAVTASEILQITLTSRDKGKEDPLPMCGVPHFAAENYIAKLVKNGYKVAICEQIGDPKESKGIVEREVVRVVTPGTYLPDNPKENNFILSFFQKENIFGIAAADITTGEFLIYETFNNLEDEVNRFKPSEMLYPVSLKNNSSIISSLDDYYLTSYDDWYFDYIEAYRKLLKHFRVASLDGYGCEGMIVAISAAGALISYLEETQKEKLAFKKIGVLRRESYMLLDVSTLKNLEITGNMRDGGIKDSLLWVMDETLTPMGGRLLRNWLLNPLLHSSEINKRQDAVSALFGEDGDLAGMREILKRVSDIERLASRVGSGSADARDLISLRDSLLIMPQIKDLLQKFSDEIIIGISDRIDTMTEVVDIIGEAISDDPPQGLKDGGLIRKGFNGEIDELREISSRGKDFIADLQTKERERTGVSSLKVGYNRVFGYYIEVTKANLQQVPDNYIRKQTLANGERYITAELKEYEAKVLGAEERLKKLEYREFVKIRDQISLQTERLQGTSFAVAEIDTLQSLAQIAEKYNYQRPVINDGDVIDIFEGRHPVIERLSAEKFVPNDSLIDGDSNNISIITGPNMAGKSTYMRQVAVIILMAQIGSYVPCKEAKIGIVDRIFTRIGASDVITRGQSTFMVEMTETANILNNATGKSLIILDEVGRGTSTFDGISIAWAVVEYISKNLKTRTLFATHYHELAELSLVLDGIRNLNVAVKEWGDEIIFLRRIEEGTSDKSYGIQVARLAGLPAETVKRAMEILSNLEKAELNEVGVPKLAYSSGTDPMEIKRTGQLDLFTTQADPVIKELLGLDILSLTPIEALNKLFEIKKRLSDSKKETG
jgi:DNA mismatch repair protein MutS